MTAPVELGEYGYSAVLTAAESDGVAHAGARAEARCSVKAHDAYINAWDIPSAITAGEAFRFHVGLKCSCGCNLANRSFVVLDQAGTVVASGRLGDAVWPGTGALYFAKVQAVAPADIGLGPVDGGVPRLEQRDRACSGVAGHARPHGRGAGP